MRPHSGEYNDIMDFISGTFTNHVSIQPISELEKYFWSKLVYFDVLYPYLIAVCRYLKRLVSNKRFLESCQTVQNDFLPS